MTPKQRIQAILNREKTDRAAIDIWHTGEVYADLIRHTRAVDEISLYKALGLDKIIWFGPEYKGPIRPPETADEITNCWGMRMKPVQSGLAEYHEHLAFPLADYSTPESLDDYPWWPDPEQFDYEAMQANVERWSADFPTMGPWVSFFEIYCWMRGMEDAMMDLAINPELVNSALDRIEAIRAKR